MSNDQETNEGEAQLAAAESESEQSQEEQSTDQELRPSLNETFESLREAFIQVGEVVSTFTRTIVPAVMPVLTTIHSVMHDIYLQAGAPYGDTDEGLLQWIDDMSTVRRLQAEAEAIVEKHRRLVSDREMWRIFRERRAQAQAEAQETQESDIYTDGFKAMMREQDREIWGSSLESEE